MLKTSLILFWVSISFAFSVSQTDWCGDSGVQGPVGVWNDSFWSADDGIHCGDGMVQLTASPITPVEYFVTEANESPYSINCADVDGDGDIDIFGGDVLGDGLFWCENTDGTGSSWTDHVIDGDLTYVESVYSVDFDSDGDVDVIVGTYLYGILWYENADGTGLNWTKHTVDSSTSCYHSLSSPDIDGDGDADILACEYYGYCVSWWENVDGMGINWVEHSIDAYFCEYYSVVSNDIDGDGDADVLAVTQYGYGVGWYENTDGIGTSWVVHTIDDTFQGALSACLEDIDGDGDADVLGASPLMSDLVWWENTAGSGLSWTQHVIHSGCLTPLASCLTDINGDGWCDVLVAAAGVDKVIWWENTDGTGTTWTEHVVADDFACAVAVCTADIDGDGSEDIVASSEVEHEYAWWKITGHLPEGTIESSILDLDILPEWDTATWSTVEPAGTSVGVQLRSSSDFSSMGEWSDIVYTSGISLSEILEDTTRYVQYRLLLSGDSLATPKVEDISLSYMEYTATEDESSEPVVSAALLPVSPNPVSGFASVSVVLPESAQVSIDVYDAAGRIVLSSTGTRIAGTHSFGLGELNNGIYFCRMQTEGYTGIQMFVVVD